MKWTIIILVVLLAAAIVWVRSTRSPMAEDQPRRPHRLDDSVVHPPTPDTSVDPSRPSLTDPIDPDERPGT